MITLRKRGYRRELGWLKKASVRNLSQSIEASPSQKLDHKVIHHLFNHTTNGSPLPVRLFKDETQALDSYLVTYFRKSPNLSNKSLLSIIPKYLQACGNFYRQGDNSSQVDLYRRLITDILFHSGEKDSLASSAEANRAQIKRQRKQLKKIKIRSIENRILYFDFLKTMYRTGDLANADQTFQYFNELFDAYLRLPAPRPDYVEYVHLENLISVFMKLSSKVVKSRPAKIDAFVGAYSTIINELISCHIPLTTKETHHLLNLKSDTLPKDKNRKYSDEINYLGMIGTQKLTRDEDKESKLMEEKLNLIKLYDKSVARNGNITDPSLISIYLRQAMRLGMKQLANRILQDVPVTNTSNSIGVWNRVLVSQLFSHFFKDNPEPHIEKFEKLIVNLGRFGITMDTILANSIISKVLFDMNDKDGSLLILRYLIGMSLNCINSHDTAKETTKKLIIIDALRNEIYQKDNTIDSIKLNGEIYTPSLIIPVKVNIETLSLFIQYYSDTRKLQETSNFTNIMSFLLLAETDVEKRESLLVSYNNVNSESPIDLHEIHPQLNVQSNISMSGNENDYFGPGEFHHILGAFIEFNSINSMGAYNTWGLENLQMLTSIYLDNEVSIDGKTFSKFLKAFSCVLTNGNLTLKTKIPGEILNLNTKEVKRFTNNFELESEQSTNTNYKLFEGEGWPYDLFNGLSTGESSKESPMSILYSTDIDNLFERYNESLSESESKESKIAKLVIFLEKQVEQQRKTYTWKVSESHQQIKDISLEDIWRHTLRILSQIQV